MEWLVILGLGVWVLLLQLRVAALTQRLDALTEADLSPARLAPEPETPRGELLLDTPLSSASNQAPFPLKPARGFRYGQALGALAILAALSAPLLTDLGAWPTSALTLYLCGAGAAGFALAAFRRWAWVASAAIGGLYAWFAGAIAADDVARALILLMLASIGGASMGLRKPTMAEEISRHSWCQTHAILPTIAICIGSVLVIWTWLSIAPNPDPTARIAAPALAGLFHAVLAALAVRARVAQPAAFAIAAGALVLGFIAFLRTRPWFGPPALDVQFWIHAAAAGVAIAALAAKPSRHGRILIAGAGAIGAALLVVLGAFAREVWASPAVWAPLFVAAALLGLAAHIAARDARTPERDWAVDLWAGAGAALVLIGVESVSPASVRPVADAIAALAFAGLFAWRGWRAAGAAALAGAGLSLAHGLSADVTGAVPFWLTLLVLALAAGLLFGAARLAKRRAPAGVIREALGAAALLTALLGGFHALGWITADGAVFTEPALQALTLIAAGLLALPRAGQTAGLIAKARGHVLIGGGLLYALAHAGLAVNPWWGADPASIAGPPLFNTLALAFAAPAGLAFAAAARLYERQIWAARSYACAGGALAIMWAALEIRRAFNGPAMAFGEVGLLEGQGYALAALAGALTMALAARTQTTSSAGADRPFARDLSRIARACGLVGLFLAVYILLATRHPWWGGQDGAATGDAETLLAVSAQAGAVVLALYLGRALSRTPNIDAVRFAAASAAALFAWSFGHALIRWLQHRGAMDDSVPFAGLEGFAHALWPLAFVLAASALTARAPGRDAIRAYLYDLEAIWSVAIWPVLAFAALGLWYLFNPWWGAAPAVIASLPAALIGLATLMLAAWLSAIAPRVPHLRFKAWFAGAARAACIGHLFVAFSLLIRWLHQGPDMGAALEAGSLETWSYSAAWALFGAGVIGYGALFRDAALRWSGLAILIGVTAKVFLFDMGHWSGVIRAASFLGLGAVLVFAALAARRFGAAARN